MPTRVATPAANRPLSHASSRFSPAIWTSPSTSVAFVDVDVRLDARRKGKTKLVAHDPGNRVDQLSLARTRAERRRLTAEPNLVFAVWGRRAPRRPSQRQRRESRR